MTELALLLTLVLLPFLLAAGSRPTMRPVRVRRARTPVPRPRR